MDADKLLENAIRDGIREGVKAKLTTGYDSPLDKLLRGAIETHNNKFRELLDMAIGACLHSEDFQQELKAAIRASLARTLIGKFGGELEKQVNELKSNPMTRARITTAIDQVIKGMSC